MTTDDRAAMGSVHGYGGRHRRSDQPDEILAEAVRGWLLRRAGRRRPDATAVAESAPVPRPALDGVRGS